MLYVIDLRNGRRRPIRRDLADKAVRSGNFAIDEDQVIIMETPKGDVVEVHGSDYMGQIEDGSRTISQDEFLNSMDNLEKERHYSAPDQKSIAIAEGALRGASVNTSDIALEYLGADIDDIEGRRDWNPWSVGAAELAGSFLGAGKLRWGMKALGSTIKAGATGTTGRAIAGNVVGSGIIMPSAAVANLAEAALKSRFSKGLATRALNKNAWAATKALGPLAPMAVQGAVDAGLYSAIYSGFDHRDMFSNDPGKLASTVFWDGALGVLLGGGIGGAVGLSPAGKDVAEYLTSTAGVVGSQPGKALSKLSGKIVSELEDATGKTVNDIVAEGKYSPEDIMDALGPDSPFHADQIELLSARMSELAHDIGSDASALSYGQTSKVRQDFANEIEPTPEPLTIGGVGVPSEKLIPVFNDEVFYNKTVAFIADADDLTTNVRGYKSPAMQAIEREAGGATGQTYGRRTEAVRDPETGELRYKEVKDTFERYLESNYNPLKVALFHAYKQLSPGQYDELVDSLARAMDENLGAKEVRGILDVFDNITVTKTVTPRKPPEIGYGHIGITVKQGTKVRALADELDARAGREPSDVGGGTPPSKPQVDVVVRPQVDESVYSGLGGPKLKDPKKVIHEAAKDDTSHILTYDPSAPARVFRSTVNIYDSVRAALRKVGAKFSLDGPEAELKKYFQDIYYSENMFGPAASNLKAFNSAYDAFRRRINDIFGKLADDTSDLGDVVRKGLLPGTARGDIPKKAVADLLELVRRGARGGATPGEKEAARKASKVAITVIREFENFTAANKAYLERITPFFSGNTDAIETITKKNQAAMDGLRDILNLTHIVESLSPTSVNPLIGGAREAFEALKAKAPKTVAAGKLGALLGVAAGTGMNPYLAAKVAVPPWLGYKIIQSLTTPYRAMKRAAGLSKLKREQAHSVEAITKQVRASFGKTGQSASSAMKTTQSLSRQFVRSVMSYWVADQDFESETHAAVSRINLLASNEELLSQVATDVTESFSDFGEVRGALITKVRDSVKKVNMLTPSEIITTTDPLTGEERISGPDYAFDQLDQIYAVAQDPRKEFISAVKSKTLTNTTITAMNVLYPLEFGEIKAQIHASLTGPGKTKKMTESDKMLLSKILGFPVTFSMTPMASSALQANYQEEKEPEARKERGLASLKKEVDNTMTPSQSAMTA